MICATPFIPTAQLSPDESTICLLSGWRNTSPEPPYGAMIRDVNS